MPRKKLLFVTDVFPFPVDRGQRVRVKNLLDACALVYDVTFIGPPPQTNELRRELEKTCVAATYLRAVGGGWRARLNIGAKTALAAPGLPRPSTVRQYAPYTQALERVGLSSFDLVWAERPHVARMCRGFEARTVVDLDDLEHVKIARKMRVLRSARERAHAAYRYAFFRHLEISWSRRFLASVVCSEEDRAYLARRGCRNAIVVPNGPSAPFADDGRPVVRREPNAASPLRLAFLGNVDSEPNADAIAFFADEILPKLRGIFPSAELDVIGPGATPAISERYAGRVRFRGFVDDLGGALGDYDMLVAPLRFGGGTKLKVLDAMAYGVPVITTTVGAEGLLLEHRVHAWLAETAEEFVEGVVCIKRDEALARRLIESAHALVRGRFSWPAIQNRLAEWLSAQKPRP